jgi:peroxiredoxin
MFNRKNAMALFLATGLSSAFAATTAKVGDAAPDFTLTDSKSTTHKLSQYKGKVVVLEWTNFDCPFVKKHYGSGNMQKLQADAASKGVVWLTINSSAKGKEGYFVGKELDKRIAENKLTTPYLFDTDGTVGKTYGAKTTPHMYIINKAGTLVYNGAIDDKATTAIADVASAKNYVVQGIDEVLAGKTKLTASATKPYGCGIKYQ